MTSRERLLTAFNLGIPDKVPVAPRLDTRWLRNAGPALAAEIIERTDIVVHVDLLPDYAHYFGEEARRRCMTRTEDQRRYEEIETPRGTLRRVLQLEPAMMDWAREHFFKSPDDVEKALSIPFTLPAIDFSEYYEWVRRVGDNGLVVAHIPDALCCPGLWFSPDDFAINACALRTDLVKELLAKVSRNTLAITQACMEQGVRHIMISGAELTSQTLMGPQWFSQLVAPYDGPQIALVRQHGGTVWYHCHGKIRLIHREIAAIRPHVLTPCEKPPQGDIELWEMKESIGD
ncbi:MAG: hypothetical protein HY321_12465, partial [Armatimonadetes bacterium]|nr:hypothetical protein [Armatimonadota bacterium]